MILILAHTGEDLERGSRWAAGDPRKKLQDSVLRVYSDYLSNEGFSVLPNDEFSIKLEIGANAAIIVVARY